MTRLSCAALLFSALLGAGGARAQSTTGLFVQGGLHGASATYGDDADTQRGPGAGLRVGYGLSPRVAVYAGSDASFVNADALEEGYVMTRGEAGLLLHLQPGQRLGPYLTLGYSLRRARFETRAAEVTATGGAVTAGGGIHYYRRPALALYAGVDAAFGTFSDVRFEGITLPGVVDVSATTVYLRAGVTWWVRGNKRKRAPR